MKCRFSEKFYEILFDNELINMLSKPFVYIPSQRVEKDVAYDAIFGVSKKKVLFIQFKVPYTSNKKNNDFRFELHKNKKGDFVQHNKLCKYNSLSKKVIAVYCAPLFTTYTDLMTNYSTSKIIHNSIMLIPKKKHILPNGGFHYIKYSATKAAMYSEDGIGIELESIQSIIQQLEPIDCESFKKEIDGLDPASINGCFAFFE